MNTTLDSGSPTKFERVLACVNGLFAGLWILVAFVTLVSAVLLAASGGGGMQGGQGLPGLGTALMLAGVAFVLMTMPMAILVAVVAWQIWRGRPRGIQNLVQLAWSATLLAILILAVGGSIWGWSIDPQIRAQALCGTLLLGFPAATFGSIHLLLLAPRRHGVAGLLLMALAPVISAIIAHVPHMAMSNSGRIKCPRDVFIDLQLTATGHVICVGEDDANAVRTLTIFDFLTRKPVVQHSFPRAGKISTSLHGNQLVAHRQIDDGIASGLLVYDLPSGVKQSELPNVADSHDVRLIELSPDGKRVAIVSTTWDQPSPDFNSKPTGSRIQIHSLPDGELIHGFQVTSDNQRIRRVTLDDTGEQLAIATDDSVNIPSEISLWRLTPAVNRVWRSPAKAINLMMFDHETASLVAVESQGDLICHNLAKGKLTARHALKGQVYSAALSQDGQRFGCVIHSYRQNRAEVYDTRTGAVLHSFSVGPEGLRERGIIILNMDVMRMVILNPKTRWLQRWDLERGLELKSRG